MAPSSLLALVLLLLSLFIRAIETAMQLTAALHKVLEVLLSLFKTMEAHASGRGNLKRVAPIQLAKESEASRAETVEEAVGAEPETEGNPQVAEVCGKTEAESESHSTIPVARSEESGARPEVAAAAAASQVAEQATEQQQTQSADSETKFFSICSPLIAGPDAAFSSDESGPSSGELSPREQPGQQQQQAPRRRSSSSSRVLLGEGGCGKVYREGKEAVKVSQGSAHHMQTAFLEFRSARDVCQRTRNVVAPRSLLFLEDDVAELRMELCSGDMWDLVSRIDYAKAPASAREHLALAVLKQAASGLSAVHAAGYVHCDIKPGNILLGGGVRAELLAEAVNSGHAVAVAEGAFKIGDFGLALKQDQLGGLKRGWGTKEYFSPEMASRDKKPSGKQQQQQPPLGPATDVYSLGCAAFEVLTGRVLALVGHAQALKLMEAFSGETQGLMRRILALDPEQRATAQGILEHRLFVAPSQPPLVATQGVPKPAYELPDIMALAARSKEQSKKLGDGWKLPALKLARH